MGEFLAGIEAKIVAFAMRELAVLTKDELSILDTAVNDLVAAIKGGTNWETALTAELNRLYTAEATEAQLIMAAFLSFIGRLSHHLLNPVKQLSEALTH